MILRGGNDADNSALSNSTQMIPLVAGKKNCKPAQRASRNVYPQTGGKAILMEVSLLKALRLT